MWTLHKLRTGKRKREEELSQASTLRQPGAGANAVHKERAVTDQGANIPAAAEQVESLIASPWDFSQDELKMFPALCRRNFWCIQRHQARGEPGVSGPGFR